jgi:hypothetical protein
MAHKIFFKKYNFKQIKEKIKLDEEIFARDAFFGGRCEVAGNPQENEIIKYFDFSGMYAQCMYEKFHNGDPKFDLNSDLNTPGFHNITCYSNFDNFPILPFKSENKKLVFYNGHITGT